MSIKPKREFRLRPRKGSSKYVGLCCRRRLSHILNVFTATYGEKDSQIILRFPGAAPKKCLPPPPHLLHPFLWACPSVHVAETQSFRTKREIYLIKPFLLSSLSFLYSSLLGTTISNQSTRGEGEKEVGCISLKVRRGGGLLFSPLERLTSILVLSGLKKERKSSLKRGEGPNNITFYIFRNGGGEGRTNTRVSISSPPRLPSLPSLVPSYSSYFEDEALREAGLVETLIAMRPSLLSSFSVLPPSPTPKSHSGGKKGGLERSKEVGWKEERG